MVNSIVRDNTITETEESFLKGKIKELGFSPELLEKAKASLHHNNPYLDNIIHLVFEDEIVTSEELEFLHEKISENDFAIEYFNVRFWQIAICHYLHALLKIEDFRTIVKLWGLCRTLKLENEILNETFLFNCITISPSTNFEVIISKGKAKLIDSFCDTNEVERETLETFLSSFRITGTVSDEKGTNVKDSKNVLLAVTRIMNEEKRRLGSPEAHLLVENVIFRIENELWD